MSVRGDRERDDASDGASLPPGLDAAVAATRRAFDGESGVAAATERRILESARRRRRFRPGAWLVPLAAAFVASAAVAHGLGAFGALRARLLGDPLPAPSVATSVAPSSEEPPAATRAVAPAPPPVEAAAEETSSPKLRRPETKPSAVPASRAAAPAEAAKVDEMALYREAHRAHFGERNYALALAHWDRYLALTPRGAFVLEARYNRGVALYRLGRRDAAVEALRPFAEGVYGGYRSGEAAQMLEELR